MKKLITVILLILIILSSPVSVSAANSEPSSSCDRVIIYMIDKLSLNDINPKTTPYLWQLQDSAAMGLLNTVTGGERTTKNVCSTISAGQNVVSSSKAQFNYRADEKVNCANAGDVFYRNTGINPANDNIVIDSIIPILKNNEQRNLGKPGQLGNTLHSMDYKTAVIGNSDLPGYYSRPGALILMDSQGIVDKGVVGQEIIRIDNSLPPGYWSDYTQIAVQARELAASKVMLIEFGDLSRLDSMYGLFSPAKYQQESQRILAQIDGCIREIQTQLHTGSTAVYVISPTASKLEQMQSALLTPIIVVKPAFTGTLKSYTTHRNGIIAGTDLKNSVLHCITQEINDPLYVQPDSNTYQTLQQLNRKVVFSYANRQQIIIMHISLVFLFLLVATLLTLKKHAKTIAQLLILYTLAVPLSLLLIANAELLNRNIFMLVSVTLSLVIALASFITGKLFKINSILPILLTTVMVLAVDLVTNLGLVKNSVMSYNIISGLRYYGLGNEYMGVMIGATICFAAIFLHETSTRNKYFITALLFCAVIFLIAYPLFGINVGGTITASLGLGYTFIKFNKKNIHLRTILYLILGTVILVGTMAIIDYNQPAQLQSHLGRSMTMIINSGPTEILNIITKKIQMHIRIINYTMWGWIFLLAMLSFAYSIFKPLKPVKQFFAHAPLVYKGIQGIIAASVIAVLFNDSGITAAAALALYLFSLFLYTRLYE
ncbi:MAG: hypothetical protein PHR65_00800 [Syntrophomonadaceae bacterium]|nr:hypothetical protein [Syntrophomonadaceae bacterium]